MGKKRKTEKSEEELRKKIQKLEEKLRKKHEAEGQLEDPGPADADVIELSNAWQFERSEDIPDYYPTSSYNASPQECQSPERRSPAHSPSWQTATRHEQNMSPQFNNPVPLESVTQAQTEPLASTSTAPPMNCAEVSSEKPLDEDILKLLGDAPKADAQFGPDIHKDIAIRWQTILGKGLDKETRQKLLKEYLVPSNCAFIAAPTLNPELNSAMTEAAIKRDNYIGEKQQKIGIALSALGRAIDVVVSNKDSVLEAIKPMSDACRLLCDIHHADTNARRNFVLSSVNRDISRNLSIVPRDKYLFGENLSERIKNARNLKNAGDSIRNTPYNYNNKTYFNRPGTSRGVFLDKTQQKKIGNKQEVRQRRQFLQGARNNGRAPPPPPPYPARPRRQSPPPPPLPRKRF